MDLFTIAYFTGYIVFLVLIEVIDTEGDTRLWENALLALLWPIWLMILVIIHVVDQYDLYLYNKKNKG